MNLQDAIDHAEGIFTCEQGAPWRWADLGMTKPYQIVSLNMDVPSLHAEEDIEHRLVARLITTMNKLKSDAGFGHQSRPKMFWRWANKIRIEDGFIHARFYIDGNPGRPGGNPSKPWGSPSVGQIREAA